MRSPSPGERGTVTAELATVIPAVLLTLGLCLGSVAIVGQHLRLTDAAALAARSLGRGDSPARVHSLLDQLVAGAHLEVEQRGELVCAIVRRSADLGTLAIPLSAGSCALDDR